MGLKCTLNVSTQPACVRVSQLSKNLFQKMDFKAKSQLLFKRYGAIAIGTHAVLSATFLTAIYTAIRANADLPRLARGAGMESLAGTIEENLADSKLGHLGVAFVVYKLLMPIRTPVTLAAIPIVARVFRAG